MDCCNGLAGKSAWTSKGYLIVDGSEVGGETSSVYYPEQDVVMLNIPLSIVSDTPSYSGMLLYSIGTSLILGNFFA